MRDPRVLAFTDQLLVSVGTFAITVAGARTLPTAEFSAFSLTVVISVLLANLHRAAVTQPLNVLGAAGTPGERQTRFERSLSLNLVFVGAAGLVFVAVGSLLKLAMTDLAWGWLAFSTLAFQESVRRHAYTTGDIGSAVEISAAALLALLLCLLIGLAGDLLSLPFLFSSLAACGCLATLIGLRRLRCKMTFVWSDVRQSVLDNWSTARWLLMTTAVVWGTSQIYMFLGASLGALAVAYLAVSRNILNVMGLLTQTIVNYTPVRVSLANQKGPVAVSQLLRRYTVFTVLVSGLFLVVTSIVAEPLLSLVFGPTYIAAAPVLVIMAIGSVVGLWGGVLGSFCIGLDDSRSNFTANLAGTWVTFTLGLWLTSQYQLIGLAWAYVASLTVAAAVQGIFLLRKLRQSALIRPLGSAIEGRP